MVGYGGLNLGILVFGTDDLSNETVSFAFRLGILDKAPEKRWQDRGRSSMIAYYVVEMLYKLAKETWFYV